MSILHTLFGSNGATGFGSASTAEQVTEGLDLSGRTYLVTGCNSGLGAETARVLALRGARVLGTARTVDKAAKACAALTGDTAPLACELSEPTSVRACVEAVDEPVHGIICNAGIMALPRLEQKHGFELQFLTNHLGHALLVTGLLDRLTDDGRVVLVSSGAHHSAPESGIEFDNLSGERDYSAFRAYGQSKLANVLFAKALAKRLGKSTRTANAVHPGVIGTNLGRYMNPVARIGIRLAAPLVLKSPGQGAATQVYVAVHPDAATVSGAYWQDCNIGTPSRQGRDEALADRLWEATAKILAEL